MRSSPLEELGVRTLSIRKCWQSEHAGFADLRRPRRRLVTDLAHIQWLSGPGCEAVHACAALVLAAVSIRFRNHMGLVPVAARGDLHAPCANSAARHRRYKGIALRSR